jgi:hypothetical protein
VASTVAKKMRVAYHLADPLLAEAELESLARSLERSHPGAAASLREGLRRFFVRAPDGNVININSHKDD